MEKINSDFSQMNLKIKIDKKLRTYKSLLLGFTAVSIFCFGSGILQNHDIYLWSNQFHNSTSFISCMGDVFFYVC